MKPTVGRIVWYFLADQVIGHPDTIGRRAKTKVQPWPAIITHVHEHPDDKGNPLVNLNVIADGEFGAVAQNDTVKVPLINFGDPFPEVPQFCTWMPFQASLGDANKRFEAIDEEMKVLRDRGTAVVNDLIKHDEDLVVLKQQVAELSDKPVRKIPKATAGSADSRF